MPVQPEFQTSDTCADQGRRDPITPASMTCAVTATRTGVVRRIDGYAISGIARDAGAPIDQAAGVDLAARIGERVKPGDPLYVIHASTIAGLDAAVARANEFAGYVIED